MDNSQISSRESLLGYLGGDEKKLEYYLGLLATCKKPFDVADRVIRPIYVNEDIDSKVFTTNAFYGSIACLAPEMRGRKLKPNTLIIISRPTSHDGIRNAITGHSQFLKVNRL